MLDFDSASNFCKDIGFTGLAEARSSPDAVKIAGINNCE